jgi:hypothetical protein
MDLNQDHPLVVPTRAALFNLFRDFGLQMAPGLDDELSNHFIGLKRKKATDGAGDMHVGRSVSGLPCDQPESSILPPHFKSDFNPLEFITLCFVNLPMSLNHIASFALESLTEPTWHGL